jgi:hypothetical protein
MTYILRTSESEDLDWERRQKIRRKVNKVHFALGRHILERLEEDENYDDEKVD